MRRSLQVVLSAGLAGWASYALIKRARYEAELRRLLAGLDGNAPHLTYQDIVDTDGDLVSDQEFRSLSSRPASGKI